MAANLAIKSIKGVKIGVMGCCHGALNSIYASLKEAREVYNQNVELLIIGGDFQAVRNEKDLNAMSVPAKYRHMGDYYEYYNGSRKAPILTVVVGGNHEASSHMWELYYGGWLCPNIYYLGAAGVVNFRGLRIAGISGIYNARSYQMAHHERIPFNGGDVKTAYHVRAFDVLRLFKATGNLDIFMSHDWPEGIEHHGDLQKLLKDKPWFRSDIEKGDLGSPPGKSLLFKLKPRYWFASHMHNKFTAVVNHGAAAGASGSGSTATTSAKGNPDELDLDMDTETDTAPVKTNKDEIELDLDSGDEQETEAKTTTTTTTTTTAQAKPVEKDEEEKSEGTGVIYPKPTPTNSDTKFLALDKCLPGRDWLQILDIVPYDGPLPGQGDGFHYDPEWLAITRVFNPVMPNMREFRDKYKELQNDEKKLAESISKELEWVNENIVKPGKLKVPENFEVTAPTQFNTSTKSQQQPKSYDNPQTLTFCELLSIENKATQT